jgi:chemotaxis response regulator CheB
MEIHILLAGIKRGPFSEENVRRYLADGLLKPSDQARLAGQETWSSLAEVLAADLSPDESDAFPLQRRKRKKRRQLTKVQAARRRFVVILAIGGAFALTVFFACFPQQAIDLYNTLSYFF